MGFEYYKNTETGEILRNDGESIFEIWNGKWEGLTVENINFRAFFLLSDSESFIKPITESEANEEIARVE